MNQSEFANSHSLPGEQPSPSSLQEFVGQSKIKARLQLAIEAARKRGGPMPHVLLVGPPDSGKSTLARIIPKMLGARTVVLNGVSFGSVNDIAGVLTQLDEHNVLLVEELKPSIRVLRNSSANQ
jgi:Holliday junction DNA helicase RuvB